MIGRTYWIQPITGRYYWEQKGFNRKLCLVSSMGTSLGMITFSSESEAESMGWVKTNEKPKREALPHDYYEDKVKK